MCCSVVPILFGWFSRVPSLHALVFIQKTFFTTCSTYNQGCSHPTVQLSLIHRLLLGGRHFFKTVENQGGLLRNHLQSWDQEHREQGSARGFHWQQSGPHIMCMERSRYIQPFPLSASVPSSKRRHYRITGI